ncbi:alpha/beta fold hydrolase [Wenxinia marina]|uniref:Lysophospholipase n=1 Tax=Wenxinia marina DSM 24838 TaxID=1123501 RepID=A0A0D0QI35_9RHOB|nr:alpha/beta fold hydrolase [Wenxinia marina]KIQ70683.1 Lysophospholipase [Wenxinia marina DSM 24838]GGL51355.1 hypothetical protein GCM10011392_01920 [Wenxinia marina]
MASFLLVHGSCHGAWCWEETVPALAALGHAARAIDLPGHGADPTPPEGVTLDDYARAIVAALRDGDILVGHSMGGFPITAAAELAPERIARLVYLCAYVPSAAGHSLAEMRRLAPRQPLVEAIRRDGPVFTIDPEMAVAKFFHDVEPGRAARAVARLGKQPVAPQEVPVTPDRALGVPRSYIRCTEDGAVPYEFQVTMTGDWAEGTVFEMQTSHSPFLSDPEGLAALLDRIAEAA